MGKGASLLLLQGQGLSIFQIHGLEKGLGHSWAAQVFLEGKEHPLQWLMPALFVNWEESKRNNRECLSL